MKENSLLDKKSLAILKGGKAKMKELAKDCVCFANAEGGSILIGIEDDFNEPPKEQRITDEHLDKISKIIPALTLNVGIALFKVDAPNGGEYINLKVFRSSQSIASTTDGKYYMRISDDCKPILPEDLNRLISEKNAFVWKEKIVRKVAVSDCDIKKYHQFLEAIKASERVSNFIKEMSPQEITDH